MTVHSLARCIFVVERVCHDAFLVLSSLRSSRFIFGGLLKFLGGYYNSQKIKRLLRRLSFVMQAAATSNSDYTARNATDVDLLQVVNFTSLQQVDNKLHQVAACL